MRTRSTNVSKPGLSFTTIVITVGLLALTSCGGCDKKSKKSSAAGAGPVVPTETPTPTVEPTPTTTPLPDDTDKGTAVPPITPDKPTNIDTEAGAALKHLIFETSTNQEAGRYLDEYLIAIYSREKSCVRLKVRPTAGISAEVDESVLQNGDEGTGACAGQKILSETAVPKKEEEEKKPTAAEGVALRQELDYEYMTDSASNTRGFSLAGQTAAVCSSRIFRMESAVSNENPLAKIFTKTGRLLHIGSRVRIWLDEEYANVCSGGASLDAKNPFGYGVLASNSSWDRTYLAKFWSAHIQSLGAEMDKIVTDMSGEYGAISDIDQSGYIEIFASPDVNRSQFILFEAGRPDHFRAHHKFKPQDLAYYNSATNPTSNEGEILYMFTPDQGGIYNGVQFPSPDAFATNYAKGFLAAQAMNLIIANQKLLVQKQKKMEDFWLADSIASLGSMYYAGNDYLFASLAHYLTSRPQYISINKEAEADLVSEKYKSMASEEARGMRAMFGWYLHTRLCSSTSVTPCDKIKNFILSKDYGIKNVETILGEPFDTIMINYSLSIGLGLVSNPTNVLTLWNGNAANLPAKPLLLPNLEEIYKTRAPVTEETNAKTSVLLDVSKVDKTQAGPYPSRDALLFQPLTSDNDMEFKTAENSVTYILLTSLVESKTDLTAFFGKGLNISFIPIGERNPEKRRVHVEKVSELAHRDLRPTNLTPDTEDHKTNRYEPEYDTLDFSVTPAREQWILGSIDNYTETVDSSVTTISDTDAYTIEILPCAGKSGADLTTCQGQTHSTIMQINIRDFDKELAPMMFISTNDATIYRGASVYGRIQDLDPNFSRLETDYEDFICQSESSWIGVAGSDFICDSAGLGLFQSTFNNKLTEANPKAYAHNWTNFGMLGTYGFPFSNANTINYADMPACEGFNCYQNQEHLRQHFQFTFVPKTPVKRHVFWTTNRNLTLVFDRVDLTPEEVSTLAMLKARIDQTVCAAPSANFVSECQAIANLTEADCTNICSPSQTVQSNILDWVLTERKTILCGPGSSCVQETALTVAGAKTVAWISPFRLYWYEQSTSEYNSFYKPAEPLSLTNYCAGDPVDPTSQNQVCTVKSSLPSISDIRHQLNVRSSELIYAGCAGEIGVNFQVCFDNISYTREVEPEKAYAYSDAREKLPTDRTRQYYYTITTRAGEVLSKPERLQLIRFETPGIGAKVNIVVGGRKQSQGKYLIRTRLKDFEDVYNP